MVDGGRERKSRLAGLYRCAAGKTPLQNVDAPYSVREGMQQGSRSDLGIKIEKRLKALPQLLFDIVLRALEHVHGDPSIVPVFELNRSIADLGDLIGGQQSKSVNQG
jgi:hypothetical protein